MAMFPRYAIYYVAAPGSDLDRFGARLLGYDAFSGEELLFPKGVTEIVSDWSDLTRDPRQYGFHATLKAPFSLARGKTEAALVAACETFANRPRPLPVIRPVVNSISGFVAIVPADASAELERLAAVCTSEFDLFRAPLTAEDRARRNPFELTPRQRNHLNRWGYPYVMEDFRFHLTLTGRLEDKRRGPVLTMLRNRFSEIDIKTLTIERIAVLHQPDADSRFRVLNHWKLRTEDV